jgi:uncharacterized RDD family membrane protein YckC
MAAEELNIRGLTGVDVSLRIAGPGTRAYAFIIDWHIRLLVALAWAALGLLCLQLAGAAGQRVYPLVIGVPALVFFLLYHPILEVLMGGRTPGKRMAGCRIVTQEGATPSIGALLLRNAFRLIDSVPGIYVLGLGCCFFTAQSVRIGDLAAGTVLVLEEPKAAHSLDRVSTLAESAALEPDTASLVRDLLDRWQEIEPAQAAAIARAILVRADRTFTAEQLQHLGPDMLRAGLERLLARV